MAKDEKVVNSYYTCSKCDHCGPTNGYANIAVAVGTTGVCPKCKNASLDYESREHRSKRVAANRMPKAIMSIRSLAKMASGNYSFSTDEQSKMVDTLLAEVAALQASFSPTKAKSSKPVFTF
jgi:hypothetical protein